MKGRLLIRPEDLSTVNLRTSVRFEGVGDSLQANWIDSEDFSEIIIALPGGVEAGKRLVINNLEDGTSSRDSPFTMPKDAILVQEKGGRSQHFVGQEYGGGGGGIVIWVDMAGDHGLIAPTTDHQHTGVGWDNGTA